MKRDSKNYDFVPIDHICLSCKENKDTVNFSFSDGSKQYLRKVCNKCRRLIKKGELVAPQGYRNSYSNRTKIGNWQKRELISARIAEYFKGMR